MKVFLWIIAGVVIVVIAFLVIFSLAIGDYFSYHPYNPTKDDKSTKSE